MPTPREEHDRGLAASLSVSGDDDRRVVPDPDAWPWRAICSLYVESDGAPRTGTGWFVGPNAVVTAGHVVTGEFGIPAATALQITVRPGRHGESARWGRWPSVRWDVAPGWRQGLDPNSDLGVIFLAGGAGDAIGYLGVDAPNLDQGLPVSVSGYPDGADGRPGTFQRYDTQTLTLADGARLYYDVDTSEGQSGGPVLAGEPGQGIVVGVHTAGFEGLPDSLRENQWNSGVRIDAAGLQLLADWRAR